MRRWRFLPKPAEPAPIFAAHIPGYPHAIEGHRASSAQMAVTRGVFAKVLRAHGRPRLLSKIVGRPVPIVFLHSVYPSAQFVVLRRELRAVVSSLLKVDFYRHGTLEGWKWEKLPAEYLRLWEKRGRPEALRAAVWVLMNLERIETELSMIPGGQRLDVEFKQFIARPRECLGRILSFAGVEDDASFHRQVERFRLGNPEGKWQAHLTKEEQKWLGELEELAEVRRERRLANVAQPNAAS